MATAACTGTFVTGPEGTQDIPYAAYLMERVKALYEAEETQNWREIYRISAAERIFQVPYSEFIAQLKKRSGVVTKDRILKITGEPLRFATSMTPFPVA